MIKNLVLSGGGQAGFSYIGVMKYLEETGHINTIQNILGVSIGSIFSLMITLNMNSKQFGNLLTLVNTEMGEINIHNILSFFDTFGIDDGDRITKLIKACIKVKLGNENATFEDIHNYNKNKNLLIFATNLTKKEKTIFSFDKTPTVELWKAVRASCTYPLYFQPIKIDDDLYVDGGVSCNYPIYYFKDDIENTLGISFLYRLL
jgi:NTE family protein